MSGPSPFTNFELRTAIGAPTDLIPAVKTAMEEVNRDITGSIHDPRHASRRIAHPGNAYWYLRGSSAPSPCSSRRSAFTASCRTM